MSHRLQLTNNTSRGLPTAINGIGLTNRGKQPGDTIDMSTTFRLDSNTDTFPKTINLCHMRTIYARKYFVLPASSSRIRTAPPTSWDFVGMMKCFRLPT